MSIIYNNFLLAALVVFLTTYSQLVLRMRVSALNELFTFNKINLKSLFVLATDFWFISAIGAFFLSFICWSVALSNNLNATKVYPIVSALIIFCVSAANFLVFQDKINFINIIGGSLIIMGIFLLLK